MFAVLQMLSHSQSFQLASVYPQCLVCTLLALFFIYGFPVNSIQTPTKWISQDKQLQLCLQNNTPPKPQQLQFQKEAAADDDICYMQRFALKLTHVIDGNWILS